MPFPYTKGNYDASIPGRVRVGGSGFTIFTFRHQPIAFAKQLAHTSPTPVGPGPTPIHPLDSPYPVEIITPAAQNIGTLTLQLYELYNAKVWDQLTGLSGSVDLVNIFIKMAALGEDVQVVKVIRPPALGGNGDPGTTQGAYSERYHRCVITNVEDGETIEVGTMELSKRITIAYTYMTRDGNPQPNVAVSQSQNAPVPTS